jgi:hypothetical protein
MMSATQRQAAGARAGLGRAPAIGTIDLLCLAAAPAFAIMALLSGAGAGGSPDMPCSAMHGASPLSGMVPMYLLMSVFHLPPWLKLMARRQGDAGRS